MFFNVTLICEFTTVGAVWAARAARVKAARVKAARTDRAPKAARA